MEIEKNEEGKRGMRNTSQSGETARVYRPRTFTQRSSNASSDTENAPLVHNDNQHEHTEERHETRSFERGERSTYARRSFDRQSSGAQGYKPRTFRRFEKTEEPVEESKVPQHDGYSWSEMPYSSKNQENEDRPRRSFDRREERGEDRPRRSFDRRDERGEDRPRRSFDRREERGDDRSRRSFDRRDERGEDRPRRSFDRRDERGEDRPRRSFDRREERGEYRSRRSFDRHEERGEDRPRRSFDRHEERGEDRPRRSFDRRDERGDRFSNRNGFKPRFSDNNRSGRFEKRERQFLNDDKKFKAPRNRKKVFNFNDDDFNYEDNRPKIENVINEEDAAKGLMRLNKYISNSGLCSRREADEYIQNGLITVNGEVVTTLGSKVTENDEICFRGEKLKSERKVYIVMNKPKDYVTTVDDPHANHTVMELLDGACNERIYPVGRLDSKSTGVLLFTNDGDLTKKLTHPSFKKKKIYNVVLDRKVAEEDLEKIFNGIELDGEKIDVDAIDYTVGSDGTEIGIEIHSGQNRVVRRLFESLNYRVDKLDRVYFAGLTKKRLARGQWRFLEPMEINMLKMGRF